jgi:plastocyanin
VAAAVLALGLALVATPAAAKQHTIVIEKMRFGPAPADLRAGDTIVWVNRDPVRHTATARDKSFDVDLPPRASRTVTLRRPGAVAFFCRFHPAMTGALHVAR